jgi:putative addiction module killer protein
VLDVVVYQEQNGSRPFSNWFDALDIHAAVKVSDAVRRMGQGNLSDAKGVGSGVMEKRIDWGAGYRIYFGCDGKRLIVLLGGGTKKQQQRDIENARNRWADYKRRR